MVIKDTVKDYIEYKKMLNDGKKLHILNNPPELMNYQELQKELAYIYKNNNNNNNNTELLDNRTIELLKEIFSYKNFYLALNLTNSFSSNEKVKHQIFDIYASLDAFPKKNLDRFISERTIPLEPSKEEKREDLLNRVKEKINKFTDTITKPFRQEKKNTEIIQGMILPPTTYKKNPFHLKQSTQKLEERIAKQKKFKSIVTAEIFIHNKEQIDLENLFRVISYDMQLTEEILSLLPDEEKVEFARMFLNSNTLKYANLFEIEQIIPKLKEYIPENELKRLYIEKDYQIETISDEDALNYFLENNGKIPFELELSLKNKLANAISNLDFSDVTTILERAKDIDSVRSLLYIMCENFNKEDYENIMKNEKIFQDIRDEIFSLSILDLPMEEKILLYADLNEEKQKELYRTVALFFKPDDINMLIEKTKDEEFKILLQKSISKQKLSLDEIVDYINQYKKYCLKEPNIDEYSDSEITEIYNRIEDESFKAGLLKTNNKLVDNNTIKNLFSTAKSTICYMSLLSSKAANELDFSEKNRIFEEFLSKKDILSENQHSIFSIFDVQNRFLRYLKVDTNLKEKYLLFEKGFIKKSELIKLINNSELSEETDIKDVYISEMLSFIESIEDIEIKQTILSREKEKEFKVENSKEKLSEIYKEKILDENTSIENRYLYLSKLFQNYYSEFYNSKIDKNMIIEKVAEIKELFAMINKDANKEEYNEIFNLELRYEEVVYEGSKSYENIENNYRNIIKCIPYLASDKVYSLLKSLYENNHDISETINHKLLVDEIIDQVDYDIIEYISRYNQGLESTYVDVEISSTKLEIFCKAYSGLKKIKTFPEEYSITLMQTITLLNDDELERINFDDESNIELLMFFAINNEATDELRKIKHNDKQNIFEIYKERINENTREEIHSKLINRRKALDAIGKRFFNYSYEKMDIIKEKYGSDYKIYLDRLLKKSELQSLSVDEENQLNALLTFRNIYELLEIKDTNALIRVYDELDEQEEYKNIDFLAITTLDEEMKKIYSKDLIDKSYSPEESDKKDNIDGIDIYTPKNFNIFVHIVGAFGDYKLVDEETSAKEIWNSPDKKKNHILCTSYIGNKNMCYVRTDFEEDTDKKEDEVVILGFGKETNAYITMASQVDIGSSTANISSERSYSLSKFRTAENIMIYCRHGHNEVDFERRLKFIKEKNIQPEYIVCFNKINEYSKKVAKDFGIPIVFIDKREIAKQQSEELKDKIKSFKETKQPNLLNDIINIYQCSRVSFLVGKEELALADEFFNATEMNNTLNEIMNIIKQERNLGNQRNADNCYLALFEALNSETELCKQEFKDMDSFSNYKSNLRKIRYELNEIIKNNHIKPEKDELVGDNLGNKMYHTIINERNEPDVTR